MACLLLWCKFTQLPDGVVHYHSKYCWFFFYNFVFIASKKDNLKFTDMLGGNLNAGFMLRIYLFGFFNL